MQNNLRPYKEATPKNTIGRVQKILNDINQLVIPTYWGNPFKEIYSARIEGIEEDGGFGTNGKGRNMEYCLASAYAEYIERTQNLLIFGAAGINKKMLSKSYEQTGYYYYPDEQMIDKEYFIKLSKDIIYDIFPVNESVQQKLIDDVFSALENNRQIGFISVPFYNVFSKQKIYLPYNFLFTLTGSNGMAAGNTLPEATFQALCEIFERYAASLVYNNNLTPPTVDETYLKQYPEEYKIIQNISNKGFKVVIKDFSCGKKLPVIGVLIIDENSKKLGSDTNFQVALSRALTEIFQGMANLEIIGKFLVDMPTPDSAPFFYKKMKEHKDTNLKYFFKNGMGIFPESLFDEKSSYQFDSGIFSPKDSYEKEVQQLLDIAKNNSMDVYMRDVSFLNFPSVYIYVPKISLLGKKDFTYKGDEVVEKLILFDELETLLYPFYDFIHDKNKIKRVIQIIEDLDLFFYADFKAKDLFRLNFGIKSKWYGLSLPFFMVYLYYLSENYVNAKKYLLIFMNETNQTENGYYKQIIEFFDCKINNLPTDKIDFQIIDGFKNADTLFSFINYPNCPDCNNCKLFEHCSTNRIINKFNILKAKFKEVLINQNKFFSYYKS